jgi:hypothetical protein
MSGFFFGLKINIFNVFDRFLKNNFKKIKKKYHFDAFQNEKHFEK